MQELPPSNFDSLGKVMAIAAWLLTLMLFGLFFNHWISNTETTSKPQIITEKGLKQTVIKRNEQNQYISEGKINQKPVLFLLDTGATDIVIPGKIAKELNLIPGYEEYASTAGGNVIIYQTYLNELTIGHITLYHLKASINPAMDAKEILLGMSVLKKITLFQQGDSLVLTIGNDLSKE